MMQLSLSAPTQKLTAMATDNISEAQRVGSANTISARFSANYTKLVWKLIDFLRSKL